MNNKRKKEITVNGLFGQFITYLLQPRKKHMVVDMPIKASRYGGGVTQGKRECTRRIRQGLAGLNCERQP